MLCHHTYVQSFNHITIVNYDFKSRNVGKFTVTATLE